MGSEGRRSHPATPLIRAWLWLLAALAWSVRSVFENGSYTEAGVVIAGAIVLGLGVGYVLWAFTYFVIDGAELRIDSGVFMKQSRRMPYERIQSIDIAQPLGARLFGLAELRIEMAGGEQSRTRLQFLALTEARRLRRTLLDRSSGTVDTEPDGAGRPARAVSDSGTTITIVPAGRLIAALVVSTDFLLVILMTVALAVTLLVSLTAAVFAGPDGLVTSVVPLALAAGGWLFALVRSRIFEQWGFRMSYASNGLRVDRGLFNRISQSIPADRVQGIVIEQRLVWRLFGWYRLRVDTAGYTRGGDVDDDDSTSTLLPVGRLSTVRHVIGSVLPGVDPTQVP
ncbi:MAG: PH domain-containing protein, partial [Nocardioidaceae bacterium]